jgi:peptidoglycan/LPS O-acetylase OafA/YrhL
MGVVRTLLAIAVVVTHTGPLFPSVTMIPGTLAVQAFYVISGFYMALVLSTKYSGRAADFYAARALRIFPIYWIVLAATIALNGAPFAELNDASTVLIGGANLLLFGQDALRYMQVDASGALSLDLALSDANTYKFMPVPQAWTLALELEFYVLAPLLVRWSNSGWC